mmetsp:Transcript_20727/g.66722  ORF Transcript_20727/g.66722 Transcript_20727/m.66722 type:complete len:286 (+) Transcript_20727:72-929(+)
MCCCFGGHLSVLFCLFDDEVLLLLLSSSGSGSGPYQDRDRQDQDQDQAHQKKAAASVRVSHVGLGQLLDVVVVLVVVLAFVDDGGPSFFVVGELFFLGFFSRRGRGGGDEDSGGGAVSALGDVGEDEDEVDDELHGEGSDAEEDAEAPLAHGKRLDFEEEAGELDEDVLEDEGRADDAHEEGVAFDALEDVPLAEGGLEAVDGLELARVEFVEDGHHHEGVEDDGEVVGAGFDEMSLLAVGVAAQVEDDADERRPRAIVGRVLAAADSEFLDDEWAAEEEEHCDN